MKRLPNSILRVVSTLALSAALAGGCASRQDDVDAGTGPRADGGRADGGRADGGSLQDGGGPRPDGGSPGDVGVPTTITVLQTGAGVISRQTCVQVESVAMSVVFTDSDDSRAVDGSFVRRKGFYISEKGIATTAARSGIEVVIDPDVTPPVVSPGDDLTISGEYQENFDNSTIRLTAACNRIRNNGTAPTPLPAVVTISAVGQSGGGTGCAGGMASPPWVDGANSEDFEGVLIKITSGTVSAARDNFGAFEVTDGTGKLQVVSSFGISAAPALGSAIGANGLTGFSSFGFCRRKLRPRSNDEAGFAVAAANCGAAAKVTDKLLITEVRTGFTSAEFIEVHNPTASAIILSDYYLYNATFTPLPPDGGVLDGGTSAATRYYLTPTGGQGGTRSGDFALRFPDGASIPAGAYQIVALGSAAGYCGSVGCATAAAKPDYEIPPPAGCSLADDATVPNMRGNWDSSPSNTCNDGGPGGFGYLTGASEEVVLFKWTAGQTNVIDVDYFIWGTNVEIRTSKTGIGTYLGDTAVGSQHPQAASIGTSQSYQRVCMNEGTQTRSGGNGITGGDETSENLDQTFVVRDPTPKAATVGAMP